MDFVLVPVITALLEVFKRLGFFPTKTIPILSIALGLLFSFGEANAFNYTIAMNGIVSGLAASGLYSGGKAVLGK